MIKDIKIEDLLGKTLTKIEVSKDKDQICFYTTCGKKYTQFHDQDCCEQVLVEDICGDLNDLIGNPILLAEEVIYDNEVPDVLINSFKETDHDSYSWTFYKLATINGYVTIRWLGSSNGWYGEQVDMIVEDIVEDIKEV